MSDRERRLRDEAELVELIDRLRAVEARIGYYDRVTAFHLAVEITKVEAVASGLAWDDDGNRIAGSIMVAP